MTLDASHTETTDSTGSQSLDEESNTPVHADPLAEVRPVDSHASNEGKSNLPTAEPTDETETVESQELGCGYPPQRDLALRRVPGLNWVFNPIELMPVKYRKGGPPAPDGMRWVFRNRGKEEPGAFLYEESALWLLDIHRQSKAEAEVKELGGWGMQEAGPLRDWDLCVNVDEEEDREEWFELGEPYEEWIGVVPPPEPRRHYPGKGAAKVPSWII